MDWFLQNYWHAASPPRAMLRCRLRACVGGQHISAACASSFRDSRARLRAFSQASRFGGWGGAGFVRFGGEEAEEKTLGPGFDAGAGYRWHVGRRWRLGFDARVFAIPWSSGSYDGNDDNSLHEDISVRAMAASLQFTASYN